MHARMRTARGGGLWPRAPQAGGVSLLAKIRWWRRPEWWAEVGTGDPQALQLGARGLHGATARPEPPEIAESLFELGEIESGTF